MDHFLLIEPTKLPKVAGTMFGRRCIQLMVAILLALGAILLGKPGFHWEMSIITSKLKTRLARL